MTQRFHSVEDMEAFKKKMGIKSRPVTPRNNAEHQHQVTVIEWRDLNSGQHPELARLHAVPNGGGRTKREGAELKAEGVVAGVADLFGPKASGGYHGIYLELKTPERRKERRGGLTVEQLNFLTGVAGDGFFAVVAYGSNEAIDVLQWYYRINNRGQMNYGNARRILARTFECVQCGILADEAFPWYGVDGVKHFCSKECRAK